VEAIEIFDIFGRKQKAEGRKQKAEDEVVLDVSSLPAGIYFVKVKNNEQKFIVKKFVKL
jgi:hypothetical protein